jgi:hypothetical protein
MNSCLLLDRGLGRDIVIGQTNIGDLVRAWALVEGIWWQLAPFQRAPPSCAVYQKLLQEQNEDILYDSNTPCNELSLMWKNTNLHKHWTWCWNKVQQNRITQRCVFCLCARVLVSGASATTCLLLVDALHLGANGLCRQARKEQRLVLTALNRIGHAMHCSTHYSQAQLPVSVCHLHRG